MSTIRQGTAQAWVIYLAVFAGGMLGGSTRYLLGLALPARPGDLPWAIATVNLTGAFVLGLLLAAWQLRGQVAHPWRPFLATGLLGSFTTWSTFMSDTLGLVDAGEPLLASAYLVGATAAGIGAAGLGWWVANRLVNPIEDGPERR